MSDFAQHLNDVFRLFGPIEVRRMFGGHGVYRDGLMFGLVSGDTLYLKADDRNAADFRQQGLPQFEYSRKGRSARLAYYMAPAEVMDGGEEAARWARRSFDAALRANAAPASTSRRARSAKS